MTLEDRETHVIPRQESFSDRYFVMEFSTFYGCVLLSRTVCGWKERFYRLDKMSR